MATGRIGVTPTLRTRWSKQPTAGTTSLSGLDDNSVSLVYDVGYEAVYRNGTLLSRGNDYTATNGTTVTLIDATLAGDIIEILANQLVPLSDAISKGQFTAKGALLSATAASTPGVLAVGTNDQILVADSSTSTGLKWATPASGVTTWTNRQTAQGFYIKTIAYNGSNLYVAAGESGYLYSSPDAQTWTSRTSGFGSNVIYKVTFGNGIFVAVGANGTITTSTDGITWTARTANVSTNVLYDVVYANSLFVAVGAGANGGTGGVTTSTDGITWTKRTTPTTTGATLRCVNFGNGYWLSVGNNSTNNMIYSTDAITWTVKSDGSGQNRTGCVYLGAVWLTWLNQSDTARFVATNPTGSWNSATHFRFGQSSFTMEHEFGIYNNVFYFPSSYYESSTGVNTSDLVISRLSTTLTTGYWDKQYTEIAIPLNKANQDYCMTAFYINESNGNMIIGDGFGRIYTSF